MNEKISVNQSIRLWVMAIRPKTLTAAVVPILAGTALVSALGFPVKIWVSLFALLSSVFIQIATNLINDYVDFEKGADDEKRLGPVRVTQAGHFTSTQVRWASALSVLLAMAFGLPLVIAGGWPILSIGFISLLMAYSYTGGPFPLAYKGLGDIFVILFFGLIAVSGLTYLQTGKWLIESFVLGFQIGLHCAVLIAINNLRDIDGDRRAQKKTLPVRFGKNFARLEIALLSLAPFLLQYYWFQKNWTWAVILGFLPFPLALKLVQSIYKTEPSSLYNGFLARASGLHFLFGTLVALGMVL